MAVPGGLYMTFPAACGVMEPVHGTIPQATPEPYPFSRRIRAPNAARRSSIRSYPRSMW